MPLLTPREVLNRHLRILLQNEKVLEKELDRVTYGLNATREAIAREREALARYPGNSDDQGKAA